MQIPARKIDVMVVEQNVFYNVDNAFNLMYILCDIHHRQWE